MNKYPAWLNILVVVIFVIGGLFALPNIYGSVPAVQLADLDGDAYEEVRLGEFVQTLSDRQLEPEAAYLIDW